jgi:hypothetical protein
MCGQHGQRTSEVLFTGTEVRGAASNSAYYSYPELWILWYPAHRYHAVTPHLPTTQCACPDFGDFAKQRNGDGDCEKDLYSESLT